MSRLIIVAGSGGSGKSTVSAAVAAGFASIGYRTLLLSHDRGQPIGEILNNIVSSKAGSVFGINGLYAADIDWTYVGEEQIPDSMIKASMAIRSLQDYFYDYRFDTIVFDAGTYGELNDIFQYYDYFQNINDENNVLYHDGDIDFLKNDMTQYLYILRPDANSVKETRIFVNTTEKVIVSKAEYIVNFADDKPLSEYEKEKLHGVLSNAKNLFVNIHVLSRLNTKIDHKNLTSLGKAIIEETKIKSFRSYVRDERRITIDILGSRSEDMAVAYKGSTLKISNRLHDSYIDTDFDMDKFETEVSISGGKLILDFHNK